MDEIEEIEKNYIDSISAVLSLEELETVRVKGLGKKGEITSLMKSIGSMSEEDRRSKAPKLNHLKSLIIQELDKKLRIVGKPDGGWHLR